MLPVTYEIGPNSEDPVSESSGCNAIADKTKIEKLVKLQLIECFGESEKKKRMIEEKSISQRLYKIVKAMIEN